MLSTYISVSYTHLDVYKRQELDLTRQEAVEKFFAEDKPEYVFLAAAKVGGIIANQSALADFMYDNMIMEMNVIHAAWKNGCKKLEFLGSSCIYPRSVSYTHLDVYKRQIQTFVAAKQDRFDKML